MKNKKDGKEDRKGKEEGKGRKEKEKQRSQKMKAQIFVYLPSMYFLRNTPCQNLINKSNIGLSGVLRTRKII